jgi:hypothetical protein
LPRDGESRYEYSSDDFQGVQHYEDETNQLVMVLEANVNVLGSLCSYYKSLLDNSDFGMRHSCREEIVSFSLQIDNMMHDSRMQIARAEVLIRITSDRKALVSNLSTSLLSYTNKVIDYPASSEPGNRKDREIDYKHAQNWSIISERSSRNANNHSRRIDLLTGDFRISKHLTPTPGNYSLLNFHRPSSAPTSLDTRIRAMVVPPMPWAMHIRHFLNLPFLDGCK